MVSTDKISTLEGITDNNTHLHADYLERARREPHNLHAWLLLGWSAPGLGSALKYFEQARRINLKDPQVLYSMSWVRQRLKSEDAEAALTLPAALAEAVRSGSPADMKVALRAMAAADRQLKSQQRMRGTGRWALFYLAGIAAAELLTTLLGTTAIGLVLHGLLLTALLLHSAFSPNIHQRRAFLALSLAPLIRLVSLSIPLNEVPLMFWYALVGAPLFLSFFLAWRTGGFTNQELGLSLRGWPRQLLFGLLGVALGYLEYLILRPQPLVAEMTLQQVWLPALILLVFTGLLEELIFRGIMQTTYIKLLGKWGGLVFVSLVFAVLHLGYNSALDVAFVFLVAFLFGLVALQSGSILGVTLAHGLTNISLFLVFPFLVGSVGIADTALVPHPPLVQQVSTSTGFVLAVAPSEGVLQETPTVQFTYHHTPSQTAKLRSTKTQQVDDNASPTSPNGRRQTPPPNLTSSLPPGGVPIGQKVATLSGHPIDLLIDDGDSGFWRSGGEWWQIRHGMQGDLVWAYSAQTADTYVEWRPLFGICGLFRVEVYIPSEFGTTQSAQYEIEHQNGRSHVSLDQAAQQGGWAELGEYVFSPGKNAWLRLSNATGETDGAKFVAFDAARWIYQSPCNE